MSKGRRLESRSAKVTALGALVAAVSIVALIWASAGRECRPGKDDLQGALDAIALFGSAGTVIIGMVAMAMRRWRAGIVIVLVGAITLIVAFFEALRCMGS